MFGLKIPSAICWLLNVVGIGVATQYPELAPLVIKLLGAGCTAQAVLPPMLSKGK